MSYSLDPTSEESWATSTGLPGYVPGQTTESGYIDPTLLDNRDTSLNNMQQGFYNESTPSGYVQQGNEALHDEDSHWPIQSREFNGQFAELEPDPSSQGNEPSYDDGFRWPIQSRELNRQLAELEPDPSSEPTWPSGITGVLFDGQLSAEPMEQTPSDNQYSAAPPFPQANFFSETNLFPDQTTNNVAEEGYSIPSRSHNIYDPNGLAFDRYDPVALPSVPVGSNESATLNPPSEEKMLRSLRPRPSRQRPSSAATTAAAEIGGGVSKLAQRRAALGDALGDDFRLKAPVKTTETGELLGFVDGEWRMAGYHRAFRRKLIEMDAEQPGAPVWHEEMSDNYTSYSPMTRDWTADPESVRDSKGRLVHFLPTRPADHAVKPPGYLMCEGLVMLDHNNRPITAFEGAPRTLATPLQGWFIESLRRAFGMTYFDVRARMPAEYQKSGKTRRLQGFTTFTNCAGAWVKANGLRIWHDRQKGKPDRQERPGARM